MAKPHSKFQRFQPFPAVPDGTSHADLIASVHSTHRRKWWIASVLIGIGAVSLSVAILIICTSPPYKYRLTERELAREGLRNCTITGAFGVALLAGLLSSFANRSLSNSQKGLPHSQIQISLSVGAIVGFLWWAAAYNGIHSVISAKNECLHNLRRIDHAKHDFVEDGQHPSMMNQNSLTKYLDGKVLACPAGGKYAIGPPAEAPTCSIHEWPEARD